MDANLIWTLQNQFFLSKIFRENREKIKLQKNRIEKMRARNSTFRKTGGKEATSSAIEK